MMRAMRLLPALAFLTKTTTQSLLTGVYLDTIQDFIYLALKFRHVGLCDTTSPKLTMMVHPSDGSATSNPLPRLSFKHRATPSPPLRNPLVD
ncbi:hypothetical protein BC829DRAFT_378692 [Chytridium lagenaria]|nr:hypothetical protein BC829DRAFT_378692 [Chytridium lagenaria]